MITAGGCCPMNFVVIDSDSKLRARFKKEEEINKLLNISEGKVLFLDNIDLDKTDYKLSSSFDVSCFDRLVFITSFSSGVMAYHRRIFVNNKEFRKLTITIVDIENDVYQEQVVSELNSLLAGERILYNILFDSSDTLDSTSKECEKAVNTQKRLCIISKNRNLAKTVASLFGKLLKDWLVVFTDNPDTETYDESNMILLAGDKIEDFCYEAPKTGMGKYIIWYNINGFGCDETYLSELKYSIKEFIVDFGWNIHLDTDVFISNIIYEEIKVDVITKAYSISSLVGNEKFVMWDEFGLPTTDTQQDETSIQSFFDRICFFEVISKRA